MAKKTAEQQAIEQVIRLKEQYESNNTAGSGWYKSDEAKKLSTITDSVRKQFGVDDSLYGAGVTAADARKNYDSSRNPVQEQSRPEPQYVEQQSGYDADYAREQYQSFLKQQADGYLQSQIAQIEQSTANQIAALEKSFADAIAEGKISVRDAEKQFEEQKKQIEQKSYQDSEAIKLHSQGRGIQHSQQSIGLEQGANSRANSMINSNVSDRDKRINDIKDRIDAITRNKDIETGRINAERDTSIRNAKGQADQMFASGMGGFMQQDYFTQMGQQHDYNIIDKNQANTVVNKKEDQNFAKEMARIGQENDIAKMYISQGFNIDNMSQDQINKLEQMDKANKYTVENMAIQQGYTVENLGIQLSNRLTEMAKQNGYNTAAATAARKSAVNDAMSAVEKEEAKYQLMLQREANKYNPNTLEGKNAIAALEREKAKRIEDIVSGALVAQSVDSILTDPMLQWQDPGNKSKPNNKPNGYNDTAWQGLGGNTARIDAENAKIEADRRAAEEAIRRKNGLLRDPVGTIYGK